MFTLDVTTLSLFTLGGGRCKTFWG